MILTERPRKRGSGKTINKSKKLLEINLDVNALDLFCSYVVSSNKNIRRGQLLSIRNLIELLDIDKYYKNSPEKIQRIEFIKSGLEARLVYNLKDTALICSHICGGLLTNEFKDLVDRSYELNNDQIYWINETVSSALKYSFICEDIDNMLDVCTRFKAEDYKDRGAVVKEFQDITNAVQAKFRKVKVEDASETIFSLKNGIFEEVVRDLHDQLTNPINRLVCGMQGVNEMLSGGFESGRVYMFFGLPGEGKSTTLLNLAYQIKKYNKNYKCKDITKTPCVVFLTMENSVRETVERLFNISATPDNIINFSAEQVINLLRTEGELYLTDASPIDIVIKYKPGESVDTSYLYDLTEDLEDDGYEVVCLIQDYIKRIKSVYNTSGDLRLELGSIVNEFKTFATIKDIPVISASQLNRDATRHIDEARRVTKADLVRLLGRSNIGESMLMLENIDGGYMIAPEYEATTNHKYLGIQRIKARYKVNDREFIYQPYVINNGIKLIEDEYLAEPLFKTSMRPDLDDKLPGVNRIMPSFQYNSSPYQKNEVCEIDNNIKFLKDSEQNKFESANTVGIFPISSLDTTFKPGVINSIVELEDIEMKRLFYKIF